MKKQVLIFVLALLPLCAFALGGDGSSRHKDKDHDPVFTGVSGGVTLHLGYLFSSSPDQLFSNGNLGSASDVQNLPKDGVGLGAGATFRVHFINHIHLGAEGHVSLMPLMKSGSSVRTAWAGAYCDYFFNLGIVRPLLGLGVGGGQMKRTFVPDNAEPVKIGDIYYNASYTKSPFFYLDPYVGLEIGLGSVLALFIKIDYMLPFGYSGSKMTASDVNWGNFMTPSGPRLHVGLLIGSMGKK